MAKTHSAQEAGVMGMSRRHFAAGGIAAAAANYAGVARAGTGHDTVQVPVRVDTFDGQARGVFIHPVQGVHPGVVLWPDAGGLREPMVEIAGRLAAQGFAVLMPDMHYRMGARGTVAENAALLAGMASDHLHRDGKSYALWLAAQDGVKVARDGYALRSMQPLRSMLTPRGVERHATYLVLAPRQRDALSPTQMQTLNAVLQDMHQVARSQVYRFAAA